MTPDSLVIFTTEMEKLTGGAEGWNGHATLIAYPSGRCTPLSGLTNALNRLGVMPGDLLPSPDGKRIMSIHYMPGPGSMDRFVAKLDGTEARFWEDRGNQGSDWLDSTHYVVLDELEGVRVYDVENAGRDCVYRKGSPPANAVLARLWQRNPYSFIVMQDSVSMQSVSLNLYSKELLYAKKSDIPIRSIDVELPDSGYINDTPVSPRQDRVLYRARTDVHPLPWQQALHRLVPLFRVPTSEIETVWISDAAGQRMHRLGYEPVRAGLEFSDLQFAPDSRTISFTYRHALYVIPIE